MKLPATPFSAAHDGDHDEPAVTVVRTLSWGMRLILALLALGLVVLAGGISVYIAAEGDYKFFEALYFSLITVSTVGYGELPHLQRYPWARTVSAATIVMGLVVLAYFQSTMTALFLEGSLRRAFRKRKMNNLIAKLKDHFIIVGCGRVGQYVAAEMHRSGYPFVVVEKNVDAVHHLEHELDHEILHLEADATEDDVLVQAGIDHAQGLVTTLSLDRDNLFITLSARTMNPRLRIISKVVNSQNEGKLMRAGASNTVSPQQLGGLRLASAVVAPHVTEFMEQVLNLPDGIRFHELLVHKESSLVGKPLREAGLRSYGNLLVVALRAESGDYRFNPGPDEQVRAGDHLIVMGQSAEVKRLRNHI